MPIPPPTSSGPGHVEPEAVPERAEHGELVPRSSAAIACGPGPDRVDEEAELALRRRAERERPRQHAAGRLEHEELARPPRLERPAVDADEGIRADRLDRRRRAAHDAARQASGRRCARLTLLEREDGLSARAFAIASTAARAAARVVMHGTPAITAASLIA